MTDWQASAPYNGGHTRPSEREPVFGYGDPENPDANTGHLRPGQGGDGDSERGIDYAAAADVIFPVLAGDEYESAHHRFWFDPGEVLPWHLDVTMPDGTLLKRTSFNSVELAGWNSAFLDRGDSILTTANLHPMPDELASAFRALTGYEREDGPDRLTDRITVELGGSDG